MKTGKYLDYKQDNIRTFMSVLNNAYMKQDKKTENWGT